MCVCGCGWVGVFVSLPVVPHPARPYYYVCAVVINSHSTNKYIHSFRSKPTSVGLSGGYIRQLAKLDASRESYHVRME